MSRLLRSLPLSLLVFAAACGSSDSPPGGNNGPNCMNACAQGEARCNGDAIEQCTLAPNGCTAWITWINCAPQNATCDRATTPPTCRPAAPAESCTDTIMNQDETDVDCGGSCGPCSSGQMCGDNADCRSNVCTGGVCVEPANCNDQMRNGDESDIDCGGSCNACNDGQRCSGNADCQSNTCDNMTCVAAPTCNDNMRNQDETDTDCGGATCPACGIGLACQMASDCASNNCENNICATQASCNDNMRNQDETDVDCGGATCPACAVGDDCTEASDCATNNCDVGNTDVCVMTPQVTCGDATMNQDETDVDCGGSICPACPAGSMCRMSTDCTTNNCDVGNTDTCVPQAQETCADGIMNQNETGVDCGGVCLPCTPPSFTVNEDFETGDLSLFPYALDATQDNDWFVTTSSTGDCRGGMNCIRTSRLHQSDETSSFEVSLSVRNNTNITFWAWVNSEPNEHFFRFFIDGQMQAEVSGQVGWTFHSYPVLATGPNGPNRVFRWEYSRSAFIDPGHPPFNEVRIDDIDMPDWNTPPTVPVRVTPGNGTVTTTNTPQFQWSSDDPDFDPITYELQYSQDPMFPQPFTTGEITTTDWRPTTAIADGVWYWRMRSKDDSDFRWSNWTETWTFNVDRDYEIGVAWEQTEDAQFELNSLGGVVAVNDSVEITTTRFSRTTAQVDCYSGRQANFTMTGLPQTRTGINGTVTVRFQGDFNSTSEEGRITMEGVSLGGAFRNASSCNPTNRNYTVANIGTRVNDGRTNFNVTAEGSVSTVCGSIRSQVRVTLAYDSQANTGTMISTPITFATFLGARFWEKFQVVGSGPIRIRVLDENDMPIPDTAIPGNSTGFMQRTMHLWDLDPQTYPVIKLEAQLEPNSRLDAWRVFANDRYEWNFSNDGDNEGWEPMDFMSQATLTTASGVARLDGLAAGTNPHMVYTFPQPVAADRFTTVEVRLRTSNIYQNDDVIFFWSSNFGGFDNNRSFTNSQVFLQSFQPMSFDLTAMPAPPGQIWRGNIEAIRLDPVVSFVNQLLEASDGWAEIDRIAIY